MDGWMDKTYVKRSVAQLNTYFHLPQNPFLVENIITSCVTNPEIR